MNKLLERYLKIQINKPTVILCFKILLEHYLLHDSSIGMKKADIGKAFNSLNKDFGVQRFRTDYILRQTGKKDNVIEEKDNLFSIKDEVLKSLTKEDINLIISQIDNKYLTNREYRKVFMKELNQARDLNISDKKEFIESMLLSRETEKKGQCFEVTAFAILKAFYAIRGFEINRFSTVYSNDGGIDYTSQSAVYQVTTLLSDSKYLEDISKVPLKNRVFVYKTAVQQFDFSKMKDNLVLDYINSEDLLNHLDYLFDKKPEANSAMIIDTIIAEFKREFYYEGIEV